MFRQSILRPALRSVQLTRTLRPNTFPRPFHSGSKSTRATQEFDLNKLNTARRDFEHNRTAFLAAGAIAGTIAFIYTGYKLKQALDFQAKEKKKEAAKKERESSVVQCDAPAIPTEQFKTEAGEKRKVVIRDEDGNEIVPTGNSVVQAFPRTIDIKLPSQQTPNSPIAASISNNEGTEFTLVGLGTRTVTFLGIQVYVLGFYVATQDVAKLQHYLVKKVNAMATTLIPSEKETLRKSLLDAVEGEETWDAILRNAGVRSAFRITPVKDTDFHHLRDGFIRAIQARSKNNKSYDDESFASSLRDFKAMFNRGSVPKKKELLLCRDGSGRLSVMYGDVGEGPRGSIMGTVEDERVSRLLWLNYLAGKNVASEGARGNIIAGVMEFVERPVGTVATQVV